jgi:heptosyltransferase-3
MKFRNIGDVLLITPLIKNLKLAYPDALIDIALNEGTQAMIEGHPCVNNLFIYNRTYIKSLCLLKRLKAEISFAIKIRKKQYDMVINLTEGDRGAQLALVSGAKTKIGYLTKNKIFSHVFTYILPKQDMRHTLECNLDPLRVLNLDIKTKKVSVIGENNYNPPYQDFIHIHPVSRWLFKCIDDKLFAFIIDYCENTLKKKVILTASSDKKELSKIESILKHCNSSPLNLAGQLTLKQTISLNKKASFFIGVDTAIMHISAANDIPAFAFFGPSGAFHWGPWDNSLISSNYINRNGIQHMGKHTVFQEKWDCAPCGQDGCNGTKISDCLVNIDNKLVINQLTKFIQRNHINVR